MRWDNLFRDLETQLDAEEQSAARDRQNDRERQRVASITFDQRMQSIARMRTPVTVRFGTSEIIVCPETVGKDWLAGEILEPASERGYAILQFSSIAMLTVAASLATETLAHEFSDELEVIQRRLSLIDRVTYRVVLRDLARRRKIVRVVTPQRTVTGSIDRVGQDFLDISVVVQGHRPRPHDSREVCIVTLDHIYYLLVEPN